MILVVNGAFDIKTASNTAAFFPESMYVDDLTVGNVKSACLCSSVAKATIVLHLLIGLVSFHRVNSSQSGFSVEVVNFDVGAFRDDCEVRGIEHRR